MKRFLPLTVVLILGVATLIAQTSFFTSSWESALGCSATSITDGGAWNDSGIISTYCVNPPKIEVIGTDAIDGTRSIRKHQYVGDIGDGGGFETVVIRDLSPARNEWYGRYYVKYEGSYYWHADMKHIITGDSAHSQDLYINTRPYYTCAGVGPNNSIGRLAIHQITMGALWESANVQFMPNTWYRVEWHVRGSSNPSTADGLFEMRVDGVNVTWCGSPSANLRTGTNTYGYFKWSTYTNGSGDSSFQAAMPLSYLFDGFQACTGTWCGGSGGGGGDTTPPSITITQPTNQPTFSTQVTPITTIAGTCSDNVAVSTVTWSNSFGGNGSANGTTSWSIPSVNLQVGDNVITVTCTDTSSNTAQDTITVNYSLAAQLPPGRSRVRFRR